MKTGGLKKDLKLKFNTRDGLTDSSNLCLSNINEKNYFFLFLELTKSFEAELYYLILLLCFFILYFSF